MPDEKPKIIYHYTSQNGLLGILDKKAVRATDAFYLNDHSEIQHAIGIAKREVDALASKLHAHDDSIFSPNFPQMEMIYPITISDPFTIGLQFLEDIAGMLEGFAYHHIYTFSLSEEGNSLSQWKLYGSNYRGFSIGFSLPELEDHGAREGNFFIKKCLYDEVAQAETIRATLVTSLLLHLGYRDPVSGIVAPPEFRDRARIVNLSRAMFLGDIPRLKNSGFASEKEWRIVRPYDQSYRELNRLNPEFRESGLSLVPYELIPLPKAGLSIKEIIMGPVLEEILTRRSLELLLSKYDIATKITPSDITVRDLS